MSSQYIVIYQLSDIICIFVKYFTDDMTDDTDGWQFVIKSSCRCQEFSILNLLLDIYACRLTVTRRVALVEQALRTLPEHLRLSSVFSVVSVAQSSVFCVVFCRSLFVPLYLFFWTWNCVSHPKLLPASPSEKTSLFITWGKARGVPDVVCPTPPGYVFGFFLQIFLSILLFRISVSIFNVKMWQNCRVGVLAN